MPAFEQEKYPSKGWSIWTGAGWSICSGRSRSFSSAGGGQFESAGTGQLDWFIHIGEKRAVKISAMFALARRRNESEVILKDKITKSHDAFEIFKSLMGDLPYEEFWILLLNKANRVLKKVRISEGGISGTVVDPKKIFQICLAQHTSSIILGHNHPSGNIQPSEADQRITNKIRDCGTMLDIAVLDHIIIGDDRYYSFADDGTL